MISTPFGLISTSGVAIADRTTDILDESEAPKKLLASIVKVYVTSASNSEPSKVTSGVEAVTKSV